MPRKVFFSFHYQPDIHRVNVVRQSNLTHDLDATDSYIDRSLWESAKSNSEASLKQLIQNQMHGSSVVCVLAGTETWKRRWVRYEIARAVIENKGLLTVYIDGVKCMSTQMTCNRGANPLAQMAICRRSDDSKYYLCDWSNEGKWRWYPDYTLPVDPPAFLPAIQPGGLSQLSNGTHGYDYVQQNGYRNLSGWVEDAAMAVGRRGAGLLG